jgi:hypothetical protein
MKKGRWIAVGIVVLVLACIGLSALRWGEMVYWRSGGERGWSLGPALYRLFGWGGAEEYRADFGRPEKGEAPEETLPPRFERHRPFGPWRRMSFGPAFRPTFGPFRLLGGLVCLSLLAAVIVAAGVLYHRRRSGQLTPQSE